MARRRTAHQVWCDDESLTIEEMGFVVFEGKFYEVTKEKRYILLCGIDGSFRNIDIDCAFENCYEVFDHEKKTIEVLFAENKKEAQPSGEEIP